MWVQFVAPLVAALLLTLTIKQRHPIVNFLVNLRDKILPKSTPKYVEDVSSVPPPTIVEPVVTEATQAQEQVRDINETPLSHSKSLVALEDIDIPSHVLRLNLRAQDTSLPPLALELDETLDILKELSEFELGRFLLQNRGFNGYWTKYIVVDGPKVDPDTLNAVERWILFRSPLILATQQRFGIFQEKMQARLRDGMKLASIPCGLMDDLYSLDYSAVNSIKLDGVDIDELSISHAQQNAYARGLRWDVELHRRNAWNLGFRSQFDLIVSNGLNVYEPDNQKVTQLYGQFYEALTDGGVLVTSFLVPPSTWLIDEADARVQQSIFSDILQVSFLIFRTEEETRQQLESVGFTVVEVVYDTQRMFPTIVAEKRSRPVQ